MDWDHTNECFSSGLGRQTATNRDTVLCLFLSQFRVVTAPFHHVGFADFWLADQLNSLGVVLMDLEYMICFYSFELDWKNHDGLISSEGETEQLKAVKTLIQ